MWCWRRLLKVPRKSNQWILKEINPEYSLEGHAEAPILLLPDAKSQFIEKDPDSGKDWGQEKGVTENEMVGWHPWLSGHFAQTPWDSEGQGSLVCYVPWGCRVECNFNWTTVGHINQTDQWPDYQPTPEVIGADIKYSILHPKWIQRKGLPNLTS